MEENRLAYEAANQGPRIWPPATREARRRQRFEWDQTKREIQHYEQRIVQAKTVIDGHDEALEKLNAQKQAMLKRWIKQYHQLEKNVQAAKDEVKLCEKKLRELEPKVYEHEAGVF
jgi:chromosome segregation ATPase